MNGATALDCENTINRPNRMKTMTIGINQYFFSCFRNCQNSPRTRLLAMATSIHPSEMIGTAESFGRRRPAAPMLALARQGIDTGQPPEEAHRRQDDRKRDRQDDARVDITERHGEFPPDH